MKNHDLQITCLSIDCPERTGGECWGKKIDKEKIMSTVFDGDYPETNIVDDLLNKLIKQERANVLHELWIRVQRELDRDSDINAEVLYKREDKMRERFLIVLFGFALYFIPPLLWHNIAFMTTWLSLSWIPIVCLCEFIYKGK